MTPPCRSDDSHLLAELGAALAEAWHVDGCFRQAAERWEALARGGYRPDESALKAAISHFAAGDEQLGEAWLERARASGTAPDELFYVSAQHHWARGDFLHAIADFEAAQRHRPGCGRPWNALAVLLWKIGRRADARAFVERALAQDPDDACALSNLVSMSLPSIDAELAMRCLQEAARLEPHRLEPFVLHARLARRQGRAQEAAASLDKARIRRDAAEGRVFARAPAREGAVEARVEGEIAAGGLSLRVTFRYPTAEDLPRSFALNSGYRRILVGGEAARVESAIAAQDGQEVTFSAAVGRVAIPEDAFRVDDAGASLTVLIEGVPAPPCVALTESAIELAGPAGWLPIPLPPRPIRWVMDASLPPGWVHALSSGRPETDGIGLLGLREPAGVQVPVPAPSAAAVRAVGSCKPSSMRFAAHLASRAIALWEELIGPPCVPYPPLLFVEKPRSQFCYTREGFIRLPTGLFDSSSLAALVCHEAGHVWWGAGVRFTADSRWLEEALAEYSLHLAEGAGLLPGYASATLAALDDLGAGSPPRTGLAQLARAGDAKSAFVLRAKGGFVVLALRQVMGDGPFRRLLTTAAALGARGRLDEYAFFALASRIHGASLAWFVKQWAHADAALALSAEVERVERDGAAYRTTFVARAHGAATPGAPVDFSIETVGGREIGYEALLNLGASRLIAVTPDKPVSIRADPRHRWYAARTNVKIECAP